MNIETELSWIGNPESDYYFIVKYEEINEDKTGYNTIMGCIDCFDRALDYYGNKKKLYTTHDINIYKAGHSHWSTFIKHL